MVIPESVHLLSFLLEQVRTKHVKTHWKGRNDTRFIWICRQNVFEHLSYRILDCKNKSGSFCLWLHGFLEWSSVGMRKVHIPDMTTTFNEFKSKFFFTTVNTINDMGISSTTRNVKHPVCASTQRSTGDKYKQGAILRPR
jgi:hypothetical protein